MALTGHNGDNGNWGSLIILTAFFPCIVFDHFRTRCSPGGQTMTSALASCFKGEYEEILCGTKLEMRRNEKKAIR